MCSHNEVITCKWNLTFTYGFLYSLCLSLSQLFIYCPSPEFHVDFFFYLPYLIISIFPLQDAYRDPLHFAYCQINWFLSGSHSSIQTAKKVLPISFSPLWQSISLLPKLTKCYSRACLTSITGFIFMISRNLKENVSTDSTLLLTDFPQLMINGSTSAIRKITSHS